MHELTRQIANRFRSVMDSPSAPTHRQKLEALADEMARVLAEYLEGPIDDEALRVDAEFEGWLVGDHVFNECDRIEFAAPHPLQHGVWTITHIEPPSLPESDGIVKMVSGVIGASMSLRHLADAQPYQEPGAVTTEDTYRKQLESELSFKAMPAGSPGTMLGEYKHRAATNTWEGTEDCVTVMRAIKEAWGYDYTAAAESEAAYWKACFERTSQILAAATRANPDSE